ncbi:MAG TPA: peptidoglycan DD-metalloendopeptidase family protein [Dermatophilaceae bacterium]|nr:peptidoglycan DD-metalloendopeptidase family protein [Dermatophilaceae bacterium]
MQLLFPAAWAALVAAVALSPTAGGPSTGAQAATGAPTTATTTTWRTGAAGPAGETTRVASQRGFVWPLAPRPAVLRQYEQPRTQWSSGHRGVDLSAAVGQVVVSGGDGVVSFSGVIAGRGVVTVRHSGGLRTTYEPVDQPLASGTVVHRGDPIGTISSVAGHCAPITCLHWGAIVGQLYRDPLSLLGLDHPILLPLG